ncbi:hypothetical protein Tco_1487028 [Tanacetum coccineum]
MSKYSTSCATCSGSSLWEFSSFRIISINITSPSSSLVQTSSALGDGGTNQSDSNSELNLRTFSMMNAIDGSSGVEESEWFSGLFLFSSSFSLVLSSQELLCVTKIVLLGLKGIPLTSRSAVREDAYSTKACSSVVSEQDELPSSVELDFRARLNGGQMYTRHLEAMRLP